MDSGRPRCACRRPAEIAEPKSEIDVFHVGERPLVEAPSGGERIPTVGRSPSTRSQEALLVQPRERIRRTCEAWVSRQRCVALEPVSVDHVPSRSQEKPGDHSDPLVHEGGDELLEEVRIALDVVVHEHDEVPLALLDAAIHPAREPVVAFELDEVDCWVTLADDLHRVVNRAVVHDDHAGVRPSGARGSRDTGRGARTRSTSERRRRSSCL